MHNEKPQVFIDIDHTDLYERVADYSSRGWRFVNISGNTVDDGVELIYSFSDGLPLENLRLKVSTETQLPSVSNLFPNAFFFENETHDLFGVHFLDISIDFDGAFYAVSVPTPMNPQSADAREAAAGSGEEA
jgi:ech hydrogenase subunit D